MHIIVYLFGEGRGKQQYSRKLTRFCSQEAIRLHKNRQGKIDFSPCEIVHGVRAGCKENLLLQNHVYYLRWHFSRCRR